MIGSFFTIITSFIILIIEYLTTPTQISHNASTLIASSTLYPQNLIASPLPITNSGEESFL